MEKKPRCEIIKEIEAKARMMRKLAIDMGLVAVRNGAGAHLGPGYSMTDITATLYFHVMNHNPKDPRWEDRDRFILSKGHGVLGFYPALSLAGYFPVEQLLTFDSDESELVGHPCMNLDYGIEASTGSLGHGLSIAAGYALAAKLDKKKFSIFCLLGDGECDEGSVWEAVMAVNQYSLDNLVAIVDHNRLQSDGLSREIIQMDNMAEKWRAFGWLVREINGHDVGEIIDALHIKSRPVGRPYVIIAHTIKGKGVSFFEDDNAWHYGRLTNEQAEQAYKELGFSQDGKETLSC